jgi:hypothetical protein
MALCVIPAPSEKVVFSEGRWDNRGCFNCAIPVIREKRPLR